MMSASGLLTDCPLSTQARYASRQSARDAGSNVLPEGNADELADEQPAASASAIVNTARLDLRTMSFTLGYYAAAAGSHCRGHRSDRLP